MKKIALSLALLSSFAFAKINVIVSVIPQKSFVEAIGGDEVDISLMVQPGSSPHSYEPKPSQMRAIDKADIYFSIGVEFENAWLPRFADQNKKMAIIDSSSGIKRMEMEHHAQEKSQYENKKEANTHKDEHGHEDGGHEDDHDHKGLDPHVWTSPENIKTIAKNIYEALSQKEPQNKEKFAKNYELFLTKIQETDTKIKEALKNTKSGDKFMVFHPAWGYFAAQYGLNQIAIEVEGKEPKPKELAKIIDKARVEGVRAIFTQPEFSDKSAQQIGKELNIKVIKTGPLNPNWSQNLVDLANAIAGK